MLPSNFASVLSGQPLPISLKKQTSTPAGPPAALLGVGKTGSSKFVLENKETTIEKVSESEETYSSVSSSEGAAQPSNSRGI